MVSEIKDILPVVLFVYNRPAHTKETLDKLSLNSGIENVVLYIYCDAARKMQDLGSVEEVRKIALDFEWPGLKKEVILRDVNYGLGKSVIHGVSEIINKYGSVVVLEDDIVTNPSFIEYMKTMLNCYKDKDSVFSISGYVIPSLSTRDCEDLYFIPRISSWGWATWKNRWNKVDWSISDYDEFINDSKKKREFSLAGRDMVAMLINQVEGTAESWAIRFDYNRFKNQGLTIYPGSSLVKNVGSDGSGTHRDNTSRFDVEHQAKFFNLVNFTFKEPKVDLIATEQFKRFYKINLISSSVVIIRRLGLYDLIIPNAKKILGIFK